MLKAKVETITPEIAKEYLKKNTANYRKLTTLSWYKIDQYAEAMKAGKWQLNGEAITFGKNGVLKNGQHRLAAIIRAGVPVKILVVYDIDDDVDIYDRGKNRTDADIAHARGIDIDNTTIAAANIVVNVFSARKSRDFVIDYAEKNFAELNKARRIAVYGNSKITNNAPSVCAAYLAVRTNLLRCYEAELFFRLMNDPYTTYADGYEPGPAIVARNMFEDRAGKSGVQVSKERLEIVIMGMNDFHQGKKRDNKYKIQEPFQFSKLLATVRKEDGLE